MLTEAAKRVAPVVSEARTLDRFIAPAQERLWSLARNMWWSWDHDAGSLFRDFDPAALAGAESQSGGAAERVSSGQIEGAPANSSCTAGSTTRSAACASIRKRNIPGVRDTPACCGLGRWLISPRSLAFTSHCRFIPAAWACWPAITSRAPPISAFRSSASACFMARDISASARSGWLAARRVHRNRGQPAADGTGHRKEWPAGHGAGGHSARVHLRESLARESRPLRSVPARFQCRRQRSRRSRD